MDDADRAEEREREMRDDAVALARRLAAAPVPLSARCLHCGDPTDGRRWCDAECRDAWEDEQG
jgi:hypothetical protein